MMNQTVHPIEIGIMEENHDAKASKEIKPPVIRNVPVKGGMGTNAINVQEKQGREGENDYR